MCWAITSVFFFSSLCYVLSQQSLSTSSCKAPVVANRLLADDVRFASPFYVIALPRNSDTVRIDNVCYTYFETGEGGFNHIISVTYQDRSNKYHSFTKGDISNRIGLAEAKAKSDSPCTYHDFTLTPICNNTVFILYRCFLEGSCKNIDIGKMQGMDVRVVLAASQTVSKDCYREMEMSLKDTSMFNGGAYVTLPQSLKPQCITKYNDTYSIGFNRSAGSKEVVVEEENNRFGDEEMKTPPKYPVQTHPKPTVTTWTKPKIPANSPVPHAGYYNPSGTFAQGFQAGSAGQSSSFAFSQASSAAKPDYNGGGSWHQKHQWSPGPSPWPQQHPQPGTHYHMWQGQPAAGGDNVYYHIHNWENPPPGCCKCT